MASQRTSAELRNRRAAHTDASSGGDQQGGTAPSPPEEDATSSASIKCATPDRHVGLSCENHESEPIGVALTLIDQADLAYEAGLRKKA